MTPQLPNIARLFDGIVFKAAERMSSGITYMHGPYEAVKKMVREQDYSTTNKNPFPLVWLITPVVTDFGHQTDGVCLLPDVQLFIITDTDPEMSEWDQTDGIFAQTLRPIHKMLLNCIEASGAFQVLSAEAIPHEAKEWTYKATTDGAVGLFDKHVCAIQIKRMRLVVNEALPTNFKLKTS